MRKCGDCQLCCKLVPVPTIDKPAGQRCQHQSRARGCKIYDERPVDCSLYSCQWLTDKTIANLRRPDRSHYVIDPTPDYIRVQPNDGSAESVVPVVQVWCDPRYPDAHRDQALRIYLAELGHRGYACIVRYSSKDAFVLFPPTLSSDGAWHEKTGQCDKEHSTQNIFETLGTLAIKPKQEQKNYDGSISTREAE